MILKGKKKDVKYQRFLNLMNLLFYFQDEIVDCFKVFDPKDTGFIASQELRRIMTQLGDELSDTEINKIIQQSDIDGDGSINYAEYVKRIFQGNKRYEQVNKRSWKTILTEMSKAGMVDKTSEGGSIGGGSVDGGEKMVDGNSDV